MVGIGGPDVSGLPDGMLVAMVKAPSGTPEQQMAMAEMGRRVKMRQAQLPTSTVADDFLRSGGGFSQPGFAQHQTAQPQMMSNGAPTNPIVSGAQQIAAQQQQASGPVAPQPLKMAEGGGVWAEWNGSQPGPTDGARARAPSSGGSMMSSMMRLLPQMQQLYGSADSDYPKTPEEAIALAQRFQGEDALAPFMQELLQEQGEAKKDRRRDQWLALARSGFSMMGAPTLWSGLGRGGLALGEGLSNAQSAYERALQGNRAGRMAIATGQQRRNDSARERGASLYGSGIAARAQGRNAAINAAGEMAQRQASIGLGYAQLNRAQDQYRQLIAIGVPEEQARAAVLNAIGGRGSTPSELRDDRIRSLTALKTAGVSTPDQDAELNALLLEASSPQQSGIAAQTPAQQRRAPQATPRADARKTPPPRRSATEAPSMFPGYSLVTP